MKNKLLKISFKEIKTSFKRFMSLFIMSMLGVGTFVGISATAPDMLKSLDYYYDKTNTYDIKLISTLGFSDNTIKEIDNSNIKDITGTHSKDLLATINKQESVIRFIAINNKINKIELKSGNLPQNKNEVLVEEALFEKNKLKLGDYINLDNNTIFNNNKLKIVGTVKSPLYIGALTPSNNRGNTTIGTGKVDYYAYMNDDSFNMDYYNEIYITVNKAKKELTASKTYLKLIKQANNNIKNKETIIKNNRYNELYTKIKNEANENQKNLNIAKTNLNNSKNKLDNSKIELDNNKTKLDKTNINLLLMKQELTINGQKINNSNQKLKEYKEKLDLNKQQLDQAINNINKMLSAYNLDYQTVKELSAIVPNKQQILSLVPNNIDNYNKIINAINYIYSLESSENINYLINPDQLDNIVNNIDPSTENYDLLVTELYSFKYFCNTLKPLIQNASLLNEQEQKYYIELEEYYKKLNSYNTKSTEYYKALSTYNNYLEEYNKGKAKYEEGLNIYYSSLNLYDNSIKEYYKSEELFNKKINKAYKELGNIEDVELYRYTRLDDRDYSGYIEDGKSITNLSKVFPTIFFVVAILISLISMSRMVEDDRIEIGTLKSLGFSNKHIILKYIIYSLTATLLGGILGSVLGFFLLTYYIFGLYKLLFVMETFKIDYNLTNIILGIMMSEICICGTTLLTINKVVKEKPSQLMRPKAPANGERVLLEKISFIWNKLNFSHKITIRNLFRYKRRVIMTIIGILGCTSLILAGFGIRDSIVDIPTTQYGKILKFSDMVYLTDNNNEQDINNLFVNKDIKNYTKTKITLGTVATNNVNLLVPETNKSIENVLNIRDIKTKNKLVLKDNEVFISDKLAELSNCFVNDNIVFKDSLGKEHKLKVTRIFENYAGNYIIISKKMYEQNFDTYNTNMVYININNIKYESKLLKSLMKDNKVMSIVSSNTTINNVESMLKTLNSVVLILIVLSGALSFVVLYNLSIININERKREIATLKVLGFTDKEVDNYINKENIVITVFGIILGLLFGIILTNWIITTVEVDMVRFIHRINTASYIITAIIISIFTLIVNLLSHFILNKIDMIESLKTVE